MMMNRRALFIRMISRFSSRFLRDRDGNVAILTAMIIVMAIFALGIGIDYTFARQRQDQINGFADSAVLAAVSPNMMTQTPATAQAVATNMFEAQLRQLSNVGYNTGNISVNVQDTVAATGLNRVATLNYTATSNNLFSGVIGLTTLPMAGNSQSKNGISPNINFYIMLDTSPSMEIAATTAGINTMVSNTSHQGGCAFGCHETNPAADNLGNPGGEDNYALARALGVTLRIDLVKQATQDFMGYAPQTAAINNTKYQVAVYTIDYSFNTLQVLTGNFTTALNSTSNLAAVTVYDNSCLTKTNCNNDQDSYLDLGLQSANTAMPNPGNGTNNIGDSPQEVLFIVSDGVIDENSGGRVMAPINTKASWCQTIKNRGIRIAFLYTTYNPLPTNSFYNTYVAPFQPQVATAAQNCASPGLFFQVSTNGDISAAMQALFQQAVATAYLTH
jgi:Flp pilus assembly protein TadG